MLEQELKEIWKHSSETKKIKFETPQLLIDLNDKMKHIENSIKRRDITEIAASLFGMLIFGYFAYEIPFTLTKIACVLNILWFAYLIFKLKNNKRQKQLNDLNLPIHEQLDNQNKNMQTEAKLLNTVLYWYVLPPLFVNILFIFGFGDPIAYDWSPLIIETLSDKNLLHWLPISLKMKIIYISGALIFNVFVIWINKRTVIKRINPIIRDIERIQDQLKNENRVNN
ncbi:hypothetical protein A9Q86_09495 [Flavobacteriales bacterium 33_180_T64]|nr:hypothetical protein A9Q86_09495 [Flavobacteriales bacterium 33_180_T64]